MTGAFVVLLTFMAGPGSDFAIRRIDCPTQLCVANVIAHAWESTRLARLQVFAGSPGQLNVSGATVSRPFIDEWFL